MVFLSFQQIFPLQQLQLPIYLVYSNTYTVYFGGI